MKMVKSSRIWNVVYTPSIDKKARHKFIRTKGTLASVPRVTKADH
jgi:hypothetical protein